MRRIGDMTISQVEGQLGGLHALMNKVGLVSYHALFTLLFKNTGDEQ